MNADATTAILYCVDDEDCLTEFGGQWEAFARQNDAAALEPVRLHGQSLWDFIADETVAHLYRGVLKQVRAGRTLEYLCRCDAPDRRRVFRMTVRPLGGGKVEFASRLLTEERRPAVALLNRLSLRNGALIPMCAWCQRVSFAERWASIEEATESLGWDDQERLPAISHGICPDCNARMLALLDNRLAPAGSNEKPATDGRGLKGERVRRR